MWCEVSTAKDCVHSNVNMSSHQLDNIFDLFLENLDLVISKLKGINYNMIYLHFDNDIIYSFYS